MIILITIISLVTIWTVASIHHFISILGDKYHKDTWKDYILFPPFICICLVFGIINEWIPDIIDQWNIITDTNRKPK